MAVIVTLLCEALILLAIWSLGRSTEVPKAAGELVSTFDTDDEPKPDEEKKQGLTQAIGYYMKLAYTNWHKEPVHDDMIKNELAELTDGQLAYETGGYRVHFDNRNYKQQRSGNRNYKGGNQGGQRNNYGNNNGYGNGYNKNRKFKNKNK